jgi:hypothetical protein
MSARFRPVWMGRSLHGVIAADRTSKPQRRVQPLWTALARNERSSPGTHRFPDAALLNSVGRCGCQSGILTCRSLAAQDWGKPITRRSGHRWSGKGAPTQTEPEPWERCLPTNKGASEPPAPIVELLFYIVKRKSRQFRRNLPIFSGKFSH